MRLTEHASKVERSKPLIVPYRDLEPLMKPGPLRDELLK